MSATMARCANWTMSSNEWNVVFRVGQGGRGGRGERRKRGGGGLLVYLYTRKKKYLKFLPIYPKLTEALYTVKPKLVIYTWNLEKWFTQYPSSSWNIPYTQFKKSLYSAYPKSPGLPWILRAMLNFTHDNMHIPRVYYATGRADILVVNRHFIYGLV